MRDAPPPYVPTNTQWYAAPPSAYAPSPQGYCGWGPLTNIFPDRRSQDGVYMNAALPPYPGIATGEPPQQDGYQQGGYPQGGYPQVYQGGYPPHQGAAGGPPPHFSSGEAKAAEAAQSAYYNPSKPQMAYVPPPAYYENPPTFNQATKKEQ